MPFLAKGVTPADLAARVTQFAPATLDFDASTLASWETQVLKKLVDASHVIHAIYVTQVSTNGKANLIQFNYLVAKGALTYDPSTKRFGGNLDAIIVANRALSGELLTLEAQGSYDKAATMIRDYGTTVRPELADAIDRLRAIPVDIRPQFAVLDKMKSW
jgi:hypothetical protein